MLPVLKDKPDHIFGLVRTFGIDVFFEKVFEAGEIIIAAFYRIHEFPGALAQSAWDLFFVIHVNIPCRHVAVVIVVVKIDGPFQYRGFIYYA